MIILFLTYVRFAHCQIMTYILMLFHYLKLILPFFSEVWVLPESKPIGKAFLSDLHVKVVEAFNLKTGFSRKCDDLVVRGD